MSCTHINSLYVSHNLICNHSFNQTTLPSLLSLLTTDLHAPPRATHHQQPPHRPPSPPRAAETSPDLAGISADSFGPIFAPFVPVFEDSLACYLDLICLAIERESSGCCSCTCGSPLETTSLCCLSLFVVRIKLPLHSRYYLNIYLITRI